MTAGTLGDGSLADMISGVRGVGLGGAAVERLVGLEQPSSE